MASGDLEALYADLAANHLEPLWTQTADLLPPAPRPAAVPWLWPWKVLRPLAERAQSLVGIERGGERRVLALANPGLDGVPYATPTLWGALQCLGPKESAPAHRHSAAAIRFVLEGEGVWTTVDGDACDMSAGDLVLTPAWTFHDHANSGNSSMLWFDGLDLPLVKALDSIFFEPHPEKAQQVRSRNASERQFGGRAVRSAGTHAVRESSPLLVYRWNDSDTALEALLQESGDSAASIEFLNPTTAGPALPTLGCTLHRFRASSQAPPSRKTGSSIFVVYRGSGVTLVEECEFCWSRGDMFVVPSWNTVRHAAFEESDLFELSDEPVLRALHLFRHEVVANSESATPPGRAVK